jgi:predicted component of type VI protein secretion system
MQCHCNNPKCHVNVFIQRQAQELETLRHQLAAALRPAPLAVPPPVTVALPWKAQVLPLNDGPGAKNPRKG